MSTKPQYVAIFFLLTPWFCVAQKKINTVQVSDSITFATTDRPGELYIQTKGGHLQKFDINGKLVALYQGVNTPTLFEARDGSRLFAFYKDSRYYAYLNPSFNESASFLIDSAFVINPLLACSSGDYNVWILDGADNTLKKINPRTPALEAEGVLPVNVLADISTITNIREYQGFLFLLDPKKGIHVVNPIGKWIKTIETPNLSYFNFLGEELYFLSGQQLVFFNLFTAEKREVKLDKKYTHVLVTDERLFAIQHKTIEILPYSP